MYGQFHNEHSLRSSKTFTAPKNMTTSDKNKVMTLVSLILITLSLSTNTFAGPSQPRLPRGNGNANGR